MFLTLQGFTLYQLFFYFIIYSVMGWIMETILCSYNEKKFVNRGYLSGQMCIRDRFMPSRSLKFATDFLALQTTGF